MKDILSYSLDELTQLAGAMEQPAFRGGQLFAWLHAKQVSSFDEMTNLSLDFRDQLAKEFSIITLTTKNKQVSKQDGTVKYLFALPDGNTIETVQMDYKHGTSLCVSTQVGCRMGCTFCASTLGGRVRNLLPSEILGQVYAAEKSSGKSIARIVLMGIGEPLDNLEAVLRFLQLVSHPKGKNLGLRHITLSTCGLVDKIEQLAGHKLPITLSVSLHAVTDSERSKIMPINNTWNIKSLLAASQAYFKTTGRRVTYEYSLIQGVNDSPAHANKLVKLLKGQNSHVNLIPINPVSGKEYRRGSDRSVAKFADILAKNGQNATIRRELGSDIEAACGQLRRDELGETML